MSGPLGKQLFDAAYGSRVSEVSSLLRDHPDINVNWTDEYQEAALHITSLYGHVEIVKLLLAHPTINVNLRNSDGKTPLSYGCSYESVVEVLLKDPRVDVTFDDSRGCAPLWKASYNGEYELVEWLIASGRDLGDVMNKRERILGRVATSQPSKLQERRRMMKLCRCWRDS